MNSTILVVIAIFFNCIAAVADEKELTAEEVKELYYGTRLHTVLDSGASVYVDYNSDGTMSGETSHGYVDEGVWNIKGNLYCSEWNTWRENNVECFKIFHLGDGWYKGVRQSDGNIAKFEILGD